MTNKIKSAALLLALIAAGAAKAEPIGTWYGEYIYEHSLGHVGGTPGVDSPEVFVTYRFTLSPPTRGTGCEVTIQGFQSNERLMCTATPQMNQLIIKYFTMRGNGGSNTLSMGQPMFTLTRSPGSLHTRWQGLASPDLRDGRNEFQRVR